MTKTEQLNVTALLEALTATLGQHIANEEDTMSRIEKLLNGNGQPGLVHEHISNGARLNTLTEKITGLEVKLEVARAERLADVEHYAVARRWGIGLAVGALLTLLTTILTILFKH